jgi:CRISPR-associated protein Cas2
MMFVILSYDINTNRVKKIQKITQKYLWRMHQSVYNGFLTEKQLRNLKTELKRIIVPSEDSICIYTTDRQDFFELEQIGEIKETEYITL